MGFLGKIFGSTATVIKLRKAIDQQRYADANILADELIQQELSTSESEEVATLQATAGDSLAQLNLNEALGLLRNGNTERAQEHLHLAQQQAYGDKLKNQIEQTLAMEQEELEALTADNNSSCSSCSSTLTKLDLDEISFDDQDCQLELILTSYPPALATRYAAKGIDFKTAFLLTHAGKDEQALPLWQQLDDPERDDLYWFEIGSLLARMGEFDDAKTALETALTKNPQLLLAVEALVSVFISNEEYPLAQTKLLQLLKIGGDPAFCHAQLTFLNFQQHAYDIAANHARQALAAGNTETTFVLLAANIFEHVGALDETENVLKMIPATGCGGNINPPLAEFWLRHKLHLSEILDTFNAACREDPDNPRWQLRVAQTYIARGWNKDGAKLLQKVVDDPRLEPEHTAEAVALLDKF